MDWLKDETSPFLSKKTIMIDTRKLHQKFKKYWPEYKNEDFYKVCKAICHYTGLSKKNSINSVRENWGKVCIFLIEWTGKKK